ncbi:MAG: ATP-binding protein [Syntrophomonadaceae bacterium]|nr:ATP-binding protein [Syntrophomonadaceae bacterium]
MFKNRIALKLTSYFAAALLVFSILIGGVFFVLFKNYTIQLHRADLEKRATGIAQSMAGFMSSNGEQVGYGAYLRFVKDIAMTDVWIVDRNLNLITRGQGKGKEYVYSDLPADADSVILEVFNGKTAFSENFSTLLNRPTLTVGTPIIGSDRTIIGVVLLHSPIEGINQAIADGFTTLGISILAALLLAFSLSIVFSISFTRPLNRMKTTAMILADGDYAVKTQIKQNDELGDLAVALDMLSERLAQASQQSAKLEQMRRDFVANISHELRTPITVIRGSLEALIDGVVTEPEQVKSYQQQILSETLYLQRLVADLLDLSTLQNTDFAIEKREVNMSAIIDDVNRSMAHIADNKGIRIEVTKDESLQHIWGDYGRLRQMLLILVDNAVKFSPANGVVKLTQENGTITISDKGIGITEENSPYIFDRFYKSGSEQNKSGSGLGLAIAKQIADRHDISITVESEPHTNTEFRLDFKEG